MKCFEYTLKSNKHCEMFIVYEMCSQNVVTSLLKIKKENKQNSNFTNLA